MMWRPLLMAMVITSIGHAQPEHRVSTTNVSVGDTIQYTIDWPLSDTVVPTPPIIPGIDVINESVTTSDTHRHYHFDLQVFSTDISRIPTRSITQMNGEIATLPAIELTTVSLIPPTMTQINDIAPLLNLTTNHWIVWGILGTIAVIAIALIIVWKRRTGPSMDSIATDPRSPLDTALDALDAILQAINDEPSVIRQGYFRLSHALYTFITRTTTINALDATTTEIERQLRLDESLSTDQKDRIIALSKTMDYYKFHHHPMHTRAALTNTIHDVRQLMEAMAS